MRIVQALSLAIVFSAVSAAPALAVTATAPVRVASCTVIPRNPSVAVMRAGVDYTDGVLVALVNDGTKTTQTITVTGTYHGRTITDSADVTLKPGQTAEITRQYQPSVFIDIYAQCRVVKVLFTDGTTWSAP
jgi:hypothetical protein